MQNGISGHHGGCCGGASVGAGVQVGRGVRLGMGVQVGAGVRVGVAVETGHTVGGIGIAVLVGVRVAVAVVVRVAVGVGVGVQVAVGVGVWVAVGVAVAVPVGVCVGVGVGVCVGAPGVGGVAVAVGGCGVQVGVCVRVGVGVQVAVGVRVGVGVWVMVGVGVWVGVWVCVGVGVGVLASMRTSTIASIGCSNTVPLDTTAPLLWPVSYMPRIRRQPVPTDTERVDVVGLTTTRPLSNSRVHVSVPRSAQPAPITSRRLSPSGLRASSSGQPSQPFAASVWLVVWPMTPHSSHQSGYWPAWGCT